MKNYTDFAITTLVPAARTVLLQAFDAHRQGADIGVSDKSDGSPASDADREAEQALRGLIAATFPDHGIVGEEYGADRSNAEYVWILDPLDGTREFLAKEQGWGVLIALLHKGEPIVGIIDDPLNGETWYGQAPKRPVQSGKTLAESVIACTNAAAMFRDTHWEDSARALFDGAAEVKPRLNCLGFAFAADGLVDLAIENKLKLYDIVALLPALWQSGASCHMLDGTDYKGYRFDPSKAGANYGLVTGLDEGLVRQALDILEDRP